MKRDHLDELIFSKYIKPTSRPATDRAGIEVELPIVNLEKEAVDFEVVHDLANTFADHFAFDIHTYDDEGNMNSAMSASNGDDLSFDCSYNTLEFSFGIEEDLNKVHNRFREYYDFANSHLAKSHHTLTGMGINPYHQVNLYVPVPNSRYRMLLHHLESYKKYEDEGNFHDMPYFGLISCAVQTHVDVSRNELVDSINTFNKLEPLKALLFANSILGDDLLCARDYLWKNSLHGINPHNVDMYDKELASEDELIKYIRSMSIYCIDRDGKYINFAPTKLDEYFVSSQINGEFYNGQKYEDICFEPHDGDLEYLRSFKFVDLTFRGTLELRSVCTQPVSEVMGAPAFNVGLKHNLSALSEFLEDCREIYQIGYSPDELRRMFVLRQLPEFVDEEYMKERLVNLTDIAYDGLKRRGKGEEKLLDPVYKRAESMRSPAREMAEGMDKGAGIEYYIKKYGRL